MNLVFRKDRQTMPRAKLATCELGTRSSGP
jgi:hypothetical protein